jgi:hypothetical protein
MADKKIEAVFGALPKGGGAGMGGEDQDEARELLKDATGWDDEKLDALHEYILSCASKGGSAMSEDEAEPASSEEY